MVWGACMVFFQGVLLLGYMYAHDVIQKFTIVKYLKFHFLLLLVPFVFFPGKSLSLKCTTYGFPMVLDVSINLAVTVGLVFFVLSTMSIICQAWLSNTKLLQKDNPYALFAVSNFGSLLALVTYPFIFEMIFDLRQQQNIWRIFYLFLVVAYILTIRFIGVESREAKAEIKYVYPEIRTVLKWFFYGASGVAVFLAVTNMLTAEIAPMPLLWMIPLCIYLLSYILNFKERPWPFAWIENNIHLIISFGVLLYFLTVRQIIPAMGSMIFMVVFVFAVCVFCQRRLYVLRPASNGLTFFYFIISLGGFIGGAITTWIIPLLYVGYAEYFLSLVFLSTAWALEGNKKNMSFFAFISVVFCVFAIYVWPIFLKYTFFWGIAGFALFIVSVFYFVRKKRTAILIILSAILILLDFIQPKWFSRKYIYGKRNYYGINRVFEIPGFRMLLQGTIIHGAQLLNSPNNFVPLTYYNPQSPPAELLINESSYKNIGMVGLGTGALSAYGNSDQTIDFYELDQDVLYIAKKYFSYLDFSPSSINYIIKDARMGLEENKDKQYDILIIDAFSGDSVPLHLLTLECLDLYRRRITKNGLVLFHLSNRYIDLLHAVIKTAANADAYIAYKQDKNFKADWLAITYDKQVLYRLVDKYSWNNIDKNKYKKSRPWTDGYSNILPYFFRFDVLFNSFWKLNMKSMNENS